MMLMTTTISIINPSLLFITSLHLLYRNTHSECPPLWFGGPGADGAATLHPAVFWMAACLALRDHRPLPEAAPKAVLPLQQLLPISDDTVAELRSGLCPSIFFGNGGNINNGNQWGWEG